MSRSSRHEVTLKRVLFQLPGTGDVSVRHHLAYAASGQTMNVYVPSAVPPQTLLPGVILVSGLSDIGGQQVFGCRVNEMESFVSWAELLAAAGVIAVTYTTGVDPAADLHALVDHVTAYGREVGIDADRIALWACSSHVPNALGLLMSTPNRISCAVFCYGFMLDLDGSSGVREAQQQWHFANPGEGKSVNDMPPDVPVLIVRAGKDAFPAINPSIDRFIAHALRRNLPVTLINHPDGGHAFELDDHGVMSRTIMQQILAFIRLNLLRT